MENNYARGIKGFFYWGNIYWPIVSVVTYQEARKPWQNRSRGKHMYVPYKENVVSKGFD